MDRERVFAAFQQQGEYGYIIPREFTVFTGLELNDAQLEQVARTYHEWLTAPGMASVTCVRLFQKLRKQFEAQGTKRQPSLFERNRRMR